MPLYVSMNLDKYRCSSCYNKKVTHGLVKGNLVDGYKGLPLCLKYAKKIEDASPHCWDLNGIVDLIDIKNPKNNFLEGSVFVVSFTK